MRPRATETQRNYEDQEDPEDQWSVDTSVYVSKQYWRRGVGRGLYASLIRVLAAQGFFNAFAGIALPNPASVALHESVGFKPIGVYQRVGYKFGEWHDVGWWQSILKAHEVAPSTPLSVASIQRQPVWDSLLTSGESVIQGKAASRVFDMFVAAIHRVGLGSPPVRRRLPRLHTRFTFFASHAANRSPTPGPRRAAALSAN